MQPLLVESLAAATFLPRTLELRWGIVSPHPMEQDLAWIPTSREIPSKSSYVFPREPGQVVCGAEPWGPERRDCGVEQGSPCVERLSTETKRYGLTSHARLLPGVLYYLLKQ